jgi:hypothetical protein
MATKRTPIRRAANQRITPEAVEIFKSMRALRCTCPPIDWEGKYWERPDDCAGCVRWWSLHEKLGDALGITDPGEFPCIENPDAENPYPVYHVQHQLWIRDRIENKHRLELFRALAEAARKRKTA